MDGSPSPTPSPSVGTPTEETDGRVAITTHESLANYTFPLDRFRTVLQDPSKTPLVLVACGSFSPCTFLHLRMFEIAKDFVRINTNFEIVGAYFSPVSDAYGKAGLVSAEHRVNMCNVAVEDSSWIAVDDWEAVQPVYTPTALVLDHFEYEVNKVRGGISTEAGVKKPAKIALLAGADLVETMSTPGVWSKSDLDHILGQYLVFILERSGTDVEQAVASLEPWKDHIYIIQQLVQNDISSTKIRLFLRRDMSIRYLVPSRVISYIEQHGLYMDESDKKKSAAAKDITISG